MAGGGRTTQHGADWKARSVEVREFEFEPGEPEPYGFITVGAKVCEVVPGSMAELLDVQPGWYIAAVDRAYLPGALIKFVRRVPVASTDSVRELLHAQRKLSVQRETPVRITFWTSPKPFNEERVEDPDKMSASSIEELKKILVGIYGDILTAWNEALDADGSGEVTYKEFVAACRELGFEGSLREVFSQMDNDGSGVISIMELDASCTVNINKGRCKVCTLPNPCRLHDEEAQREAMRKEYNAVHENTGAYADEAGAQVGLAQRVFDFVAVRVREFVRSWTGQRNARKGVRLQHWKTWDQETELEDGTVPP